jgi:hypothetical protein
MGKYEAAKILKLTKARSARTCEMCGDEIKEGAKYFRESIGPMAKPPALHLKSFCLGCGKCMGGLSRRGSGDMSHQNEEYPPRSEVGCGLKN